jgi:hypothetical protein
MLEQGMRRIVPIAVFAFCAMIVGVVTSAQSSEQLRRLTHAERKAYHACLNSSWVRQYCWLHASGYLWDYDMSVHECVIANGGGRKALDAYPAHAWNIADACWRYVQEHR